MSVNCFDATERSLLNFLLTSERKQLFLILNNVLPISLQLSLLPQDGSIKMKKDCYYTNFDDWNKVCLCYKIKES